MMMFLGKRTLLVLLTALSIVAPMLSVAGVAARQPRGVSYELPALILTPVDLGNVGMAAYPIDDVNGMLQSAQETAQAYVDSEGFSADRAKAVFVDSGLR